MAGAGPIINARGIYTDLGGSCLSPTVWAAAAQANERFYQLPMLLDQSGLAISRMLDVPAARVTPGASAAISMAVGACMTGGDGQLMERLPDSNGMPSEVLMQTLHRYKYARCARLSGGRIHEVGNGFGTSRADLAEALHHDRVVCVLHPAHLDGVGNTLTLSDVLSLAQPVGIPVIVDAAYMSYPPHWITAYRVADLVCLSAKYFWGPNSGGFVYGRPDLIDAIARIDFTRFESGPDLIFGRAYKLDRTSVVATTVALEEWLVMDHAKRWQGYMHKAERICAAASTATGAGTGCFTLGEQVVRQPLPQNFVPYRHLPSVAALCETPGTVNAAIVDLDSYDEAQSVAGRLTASEPPILCIVDGVSLVFCTETVLDGEEEIISERLRAGLAR